MNILTAFALLIAAAAHLAAAAHHRDSPIAMVSFVVIAIAQGALAAVRLRRDDAAVHAVVGITSLAMIGLWAASRWTGVSIGHSHEPGAVGTLDATAVVAQLVALAAVTKTLSGRARWTGAAGMATAIALLLAVALAPEPRPASDTDPHHDDRHAEHHALPDLVTT